MSPRPLPLMHSTRYQAGVATEISHWLKWPRRTACGIEHQAQPGAEQGPSCPRCLAALASHFPGLRYRIHTTVPLEDLGLEPGLTFASYEAADAVARLKRRSMLRLVRKHGPGVVVAVAPDFSLVDPAAPVQVAP